MGERLNREKSEEPRSGRMICIPMRSRRIRMCSRRNRTRHNLVASSERHSSGAAKVRRADEARLNQDREIRPPHQTVRGYLVRRRNE